MTTAEAVDRCRAHSHNMVSEPHTARVSASGAAHHDPRRDAAALGWHRQPEHAAAEAEVVLTKHPGRTGTEDHPATRLRGTEETSLAQLTVRQRSRQGQPDGRMPVGQRDEQRTAVDNQVGR
jgi:hypothetical protein